MVPENFDPMSSDVNFPAMNIQQQQQQQQQNCPPIHLHQPNPNRKETFLLATVIISLLIISIVTTITLLVIIYRLRLVPGFEFFTILGDNVILHKDTYIDRLLLNKNRITGLKTITGNVALESGKSSLRLNQDGIEMHSKKGFEIRSVSTGKLLYPFDFSSLPLTSIKTLSVPNGIKDVKLIRSPLDEDLNINSKSKIRIRGNEGVNVEGKQIKIDAKSVFLSSLNSSVIFDGHKGIYFNMETFKKRIVRHRNQTETMASTNNEELNLQYKLCICGRNGRLFRMAIKDSSSSCADARFPQSDNPCLL